LKDLEGKGESSRDAPLLMLLLLLPYLLQQRLMLLLHPNVEIDRSHAGWKVIARIVARRVRKGDRGRVGQRQTGRRLVGGIVRGIGREKRRAEVRVWG